MRKLLTVILATYLLYSCAPVAGQGSRLGNTLGTGGTGGGLSQNLVPTVPSFWMYANQAANPTITTYLNYLLNDPGYAAAAVVSRRAGGTHCQELLQWSAMEPTVGSFPLDSFITRLVSNCGTNAIWVNFAAVDTDGARHVPSSLSALAWNDPLMIAGYNGLIDHYAAMFGGRFQILLVGNEINTYFSTHLSELPAFATFIRDVRTHARAVFGTNVFKIGASWTYTGAAADWTTYSGVASEMDVKAFTYYFFSTTTPQQISDEFLNTANLANGPYIYQEIGFPSDTATLGQSQATQNTIATQAMGLLDTYAATRQLLGATWFQLSDYQENVLANVGYVTPLLQYFATAGLRDTGNQPKLAFTTLCTHWGGTSCDK